MKQSIQQTQEHQKSGNIQKQNELEKKIEIVEENIMIQMEETKEINQSIDIIKRQQNQTITKTT